MGHGHVTPNADGTKARCGGPAICGECAREAARLGVAYPLLPLAKPREEMTAAEIIDQQGQTIGRLYRELEETRRERDELRRRIEGRETAYERPAPTVMPGELERRR